MIRRLPFVLAVLAGPGVAHAQLFSPGKLSKAHAELEGLSNCTKCHPRGGQLAEGPCLACHDELRERVAEKRGLHGRMAPGDRACESCHAEHRGREHALVDWTPRRFDHLRAGYRLKGAHAKADCERCHEPRLLRDPGVKRLAAERRPGTFLGLGRACADCHFDEHRGQLSEDCGSCHAQDAFAPAPGFSHGESDFPLRGRHRKLDCEGCHPEEPGDAPPSAFPAPMRDALVRYAPLEHEGCADCHEDPHRGRFGRDCARCHSEAGWKKVDPSAFGERAFHAETRFPLEGAHGRVACESCHLPLGARTPVYGGLAHERCADCHFDAHDGQVSLRCEDCHTVDAFSPPTFGVEAHARTAYPLAGAHLAVACAECHETKSPAPAPSAAVRRALARRARRPLLSAAKLELSARRCAECHPGPHGAQLEHCVRADGCEGCHEVSAWSALDFDHDEDARFALTGAHATARCASCHAPPSPGEPVRYRPLDQACASCHFDVHLGQLAEADRKTDCAGCHDTETFAIERFDHARSGFALEGAHASVACAKCHQTLSLAERELVHYRPLGQRCESCHLDFHEGAFAGVLIGEGSETGCAKCHTTAGWARVGFDHARVGWALEGRHAEARCGSCHGADLGAPLDRDCASCHRDPHRGELGLRCEGCHEQGEWESRFDVVAHRDRGFPLSGAHALIPCESCHDDAFGRGFVRAAAGCVKCHADDYDRTRLGSLDHFEAGFGTDCERCHNPWRFEGARFDAHDACFLISAGDHAGITCQGCHESLQGARVTGACDTRTARCTGCHEHERAETDEEHDDVPGYQYQDRKCYECHRFAD